jgi:hypothetical protein
MYKFTLDEIDVLVTRFLLCPHCSHPSKIELSMSTLTINHTALSTMFKGLRHPISSSEAEVWQFRGIKYGNLPSRFKQSILNETFPDVSDATTYG